MDTPMVEKSKLDGNPQGKEVNPTHYRGSTSGSMQLLVDRLVSCSLKKQKSTAISSIEAECIALSDIFTKELRQELLDFLINMLGMRSMSSETLKSLADEEDE
ncbi:hypothetical protein Tco_0946152 [Tanacetum coccineum]